LTTLVSTYLDRVRASADAVALLEGQAGPWLELTWSALDGRVREVAFGLMSLGVERHERCALILRTQVGFYPCALGALCVGAAITTVYPTSAADQLARLLADVDPSIIFVEDAEQAAKLVNCRARLPSLRQVVQLHGEVLHADVMAFDCFRAKGKEWRALAPDALDRRMASILPDDVATVIYTSGTTGEPKGVELTHRAWTHVSRAVEALGAITSQDLQYFWLPMAHSFGLLMMAVQLAVGFPTAVDGNVEALMKNVASVRPTFLCAVPRVFEKAHSKIRAALEGGPRWRRLSSAWALELGLRHSRRRRAGKPIGRRLALGHALADALVLRKIRERFGGRLRFFLSGGVALNPQVAEFFDALGLPILEGWGMTETCGVCNVNVPGRYQFGTVGTPIAGVEVRLAEDGEILIRSPALMRGYFRQPERTREALDETGWLRTGDVGRLDGEFLVIVERKRDLIKTAGGRFVAPQHLEARLKSACPLLAQVLVHGEGRPFCCALVTLDAEMVRTRALAADTGLASGSISVVLAQASCQIADAIDALNQELSSFEQIRKFKILDHELSVESGEITPSLKMRRRAVEDRYRREIESIYDVS
jgi:long-chain acyl-CoA synthetase